MTNDTKQSILFSRSVDQWTFLAVLCFGFSSWMMTNAAYVEMGAFLEVLPEHYSISADILFALQLANIYPALYLLCNAREKYWKHTTTIWGLLSLTIIVTIAMSIFWDQTTVFNGQPHSAAMLLCTHLGGLVSATSTVTFYPYIATYPAVYTSALSTGEGLSGSIVAILGAFQARNGFVESDKSVTIFYLFVAFIMMISLGGFYFLQFYSNERREQPLLQTSREPQNLKYSNSIAQLVLCQFLLAAYGFGILPSIMPYVYKKAAPLDDVIQATASYQVAANTIFLILDPLARLTTSRWRCFYVRWLSASLVLIATVLLYWSLRSHPFPQSSSDSMYFIFPLAGHIVYIVGYAYTQTMIYLTIKRDYGQGDALQLQSSYQICGMATQLGAFTGTCIIFYFICYHENLFL